jgi:hypothetical protein
MSRSSVVFAVIFVVAIGLTLGLSELYTSIIAPAFAPQPTLDQKYEKAIQDAMIAQQNEVCNTLTPITRNNSNLIWQGEGDNATVLVVTWTKYTSSYPVNGTVNTSWGDVWVTVAPEIQTFFHNHVNTNLNATIRTAELLGMPANTSNTAFVELWVNPQSLFRPAPDNEITDTTAGLTFPANATTQYKTWFNNNIIYSYYPMKYPWTRLGYTYDWGSSNHVGLSEFILTQNSTVTVNSVTPTAEYLK